MVEAVRVGGAANPFTAEAIRTTALRLFAKHGFDATTIDDIAAAAGIGRRTFFRYYASKNDIPFGDVDAELGAMEEWLASAANDMPLLDALTEAVVRFNTVHSDGPAAHRWRIRLIHTTPALQAHRTLRIAQEQAVLARFVARRLGEPLEGIATQFLAQMAVGATTAAYNVWLEDQNADLELLLREAFAQIRLAPGVEERPRKASNLTGSRRGSAAESRGKVRTRQDG